MVGIAEGQFRGLALGEAAKQVEAGCHDGGARGEGGYGSGRKKGGEGGYGSGRKKGGEEGCRDGGKVSRRRGRVLEMESREGGAPQRKTDMCVA